MKKSVIPGPSSKPTSNLREHAKASTTPSGKWPWPKVSSMQALMRMANARRGPLWPATQTVNQQLVQNQSASPAEKPLVKSWSVQASSASSAAQATTNEQAAPTSEQTATTSRVAHTSTSLKHRLWPGGSQPLAKRRRWDLPKRDSTAGNTNRPLDVDAAITAVLDDTYTAASRRSVAARVEWWRRAAAKRGVTPFPLDTSKLTLAGALLKHGKYKSASQYLYSIKKEHLRQGHTWPEQFAVQLNDLRRSCARGLGGPIQADAFILEAHTASNPFIFQALPHAAEAIIVGTRWLLREIDLAALQVQDVTMEAGRGCGRTTIWIGPDKVNTKGKKCPRSLECCCPETPCPVAAVKVLLAAAAARSDSQEENLVCTTTGEGVSKSRMVEAIVAYAAHGKVVGKRITGHSMRTTGAQWLAARNVSEGRISFFGRWVSRQVLRYARESLLAHPLVEPPSEVAPRAAATSSLAIASSPSISSRRSWPKLQLGSSRHA